MQWLAFSTFCFSHSTGPANLSELNVKATEEKEGKLVVMHAVEAYRIREV
jgi:hypothetical protein